MLSGIKAEVMCTQLLSSCPEFPAALLRALHNCCTAAYRGSFYRDVTCILQLQPASQ